MSVELGSTQDARRLLPGDVGAVVRVMRDLRELGDSAETAGKSLARIETEQGWRGVAAESFRARFADEPRRWREAGEAFHRAASALDDYATALQWGQGQAQLAVRLWDQGDASPMPPTAVGAGRAALAAAQVAGPGEAYRGHARQVLAEARDKVRRTGDLARCSVVDAMATAPKAPGFWARVRGYAGAVKNSALDLGAETVNGLASFGNAAVHHPEDVAAAAAGISMMSAGSGGEAAGVALDVTGAGALAGVPLNVASAATITAGSVVAGTAVSDLVYHATRDDSVSPVKRPKRGASRADGGTVTDRYKEQLTDKSLDGARRELKGEVVSRQRNGTPYDHVQKVRQAQSGLVTRIQQLKQALRDPRTAPADRVAKQAELTEASRLLDYSEQFVPRR